MRKSLLPIVVLAGVLLFAACDDDSSGGGSGAYTVGGTVTGLGTGLGLVLENNGTDEVGITSDGTFVFPTSVGDGEGYDVTVKEQPRGQTCTVEHGTGVVSGADVTDVVVTCSVNTYTLGGTVTGLDGTLVLENSNGDEVTVTNDGTFVFSQAVADGSRYEVTVKQQPEGQTCTVEHGTGVVSGADVTDVVVTCSVNTYTLGGTVTGLVSGAGLVLENSNGDEVSIAQDGTFVFGEALADGSGYEVTVKEQPRGQTCTVEHGTGVISGSDVTDVVVTCAVNTYTVGGTVTGLFGSVVLQLNGGTVFLVTRDGTFVFGDELPDGARYEVTVKEQPEGQTCTVEHGTGVVSGSDVTDVVVTCAVNTYTVGGTITGLVPGAGLTLQNNGGDDLSVTQDGTFVFSQPLADGSGYEVTIKNLPAGQNCEIMGATGTVSGTDVTDVTVTCWVNSTPVADATVLYEYVNLDVTTVVDLDGSGSFDADGDPLTYQWTILSTPATSLATLEDATSMNARLLPDRAGRYIVGLVVSDGLSSSDVAEVTVYVERLPDTGQVINYTSTPGEDSDYSINPPSFTDNGDGTVRDNVTGLMWQKVAFAPEYNWYQAMGIPDDAYNPGGITSVCGNLTLGGYDDWRVPTKKELVSIIDYGVSQPALDTSVFGFSEDPSTYFYVHTATEYDAQYAWAMQIQYGTFAPNFIFKFKEASVRCVRGSYRVGNFVDNGDGTVSDRYTGLMWQQGYAPSTMTWEEALAYCDTLELAGYDDWRLPNVKELDTLADESRSYPAIDTTFFPNMPAGEARFWASTTYRPNISIAWYVRFDKGYVYAIYKDNDYYVRCVR